MSRLASVGRGMMSSDNSGGHASGNQSVYDEPGAAMLRYARSRDFRPFFNIEPRTRAYRKSQMDKEGIEKQRLKERKGGFHKYTEFKAVTGSEPGEPGYCSEASRFDTDTVGEEQRRKQQVLAAQQHLYDARKQQRKDREDLRWRRMEDEKQAETEKYERYRSDPLMGKKNVSGSAYDPVTLNYNDGDDGRRMAYEDSKIRYRAARRAKNIHEKTTSVNYNVITGADASRLPTPVDPGPVPDYAYAEHSGYI